MACTGHPEASGVTTTITCASGLCRPKNIVPRCWLNVVRHTLQRGRRLCFWWIVIVPSPVLPRAEPFHGGTSVWMAPWALSMVCAFSPVCLWTRVCSHPLTVQRFAGLYLLS